MQPIAVERFSLKQPFETRIETNPFQTKIETKESSEARCSGPPQRSVPPATTDNKRHNPGKAAARPSRGDRDSRVPLLNVKEQAWSIARSDENRNSV